MRRLMTCVMFGRKLSQQARVVQQARVAVQSANKNITVVPLKRQSTDNSGPPKVGTKRQSTDSSWSSEPIKVAKVEPSIADVGPGSLAGACYSLLLSSCLTSLISVFFTATSPLYSFFPSNPTTVNLRHMKHKFPKAALNT